MSKPFDKEKNWLVCWIEVGAECVGVVQSLLMTCRLQGVDPYTYLVDALQRISAHPANRVAELTPREWKTRFSQTPVKTSRSPRGNGLVWPNVAQFELLTTAAEAPKLVEGALN